MARGTINTDDDSARITAALADARFELKGHERELEAFDDYCAGKPEPAELLAVCNAIIADRSGRALEVIRLAHNSLLEARVPAEPESDPDPTSRTKPESHPDHWVVEKMKALSPKAFFEWALVFLVVTLAAFAALLSVVMQKRDGNIDLGRETVRDIPDPKELVGTLWMIDATNPPQYLIAPPYAQRQLACSAFDDPGNLLCLAPPSRRGTRAFDLRLGRNIAVETTAGPAPPKPSNDARWKASSEPPGHQTHTVVGNLYLIPATAPPQYLVRYLDSERSNIVLHCQAHEKAPAAAAYAKVPTGDVREAAKLDAAAQIRCQPFRINPALQAGTFFDVSRGAVARAPDDLAAAPLPVLTFLQALPVDLRYNGLFIEDDPSHQERR